MARETFYLPLMIAVAVSVACAVALLVAVSEKKAQAAFPGHNGKIAYTEYDSYPDEDREIYTMNADGTDLKQLTDNSANEFARDVSPDGKRIAFIAFLGANEGDLYKVKSDGSGEYNEFGLVRRLFT